jgi:predicted transcriptional regulator
MAKKTTWILDTGMLFKVACDSADSIQAPPRQSEQAPALVSIVFSVLTLEAFLNEMSEMMIFPLPEKPTVVTVLAEFLQDAERSHASLESKFALANWILSKKKFDRGVQPYQDFCLLVRLRNDLVHFRVNDVFEEEDYPEELKNDAGFKNEAVQLGNTHQNLINRFSGKNILAENMSGKKVSWTALVKTKAVAEWSCRTAAYMITDFCTKVPRSYKSWFISRFQKSFDPQKLFSSAGNASTKAARKSIKGK